MGHDHHDHASKKRLRVPATATAKETAPEIQRTTASTTDQTTGTYSVDGTLMPHDQDEPCPDRASRPANGFGLKTARMWQGNHVGQVVPRNE